MPEYTFRFHFPKMDSDRQTQEVKSWGGHLGTALSRAWKALKKDRMYQGIKGLRPSQIDVDVAS